MLSVWIARLPVNRLGGYYFMTAQLSLFGNKEILPMTEELPTVVQWLEKMGFTGRGGQYDSNILSTFSDECKERDVLAAPTRRGVKKLTQDQLKEIKKKYKDNKEKLSDIRKETLYEAIRVPADAVRTLNLERLPADAMAFYRFFHFPPYDQWGIYLLVDKVVQYHKTLSSILGNLKAFSASTLMHYIVFEVFHHEFFHHIAESTATSLEIISAGLGNPRPIFLEYNRRKHSDKEIHKHTPLEEALANAYAYNSLSFITRVGMSYKTGGVKLFQAAMQRYWTTEPPGYRSAQHYIHGKHIVGGAHLLALMMDSPDCLMDVPLTRLSKSVMPSGFSAFVAKPDIPTYLVGSKENLEIFYNLVPAPNEAYTRLYWPYDTADLDDLLQQEKKKEQEAKKKKKQNEVKK